MIPLSLVNYKYKSKTVIGATKTTKAPIENNNENLESNEQKMCESLKSLFKSETLVGTQNLRDLVLSKNKKNSQHQYSTCGSTAVPKFNEYVADLKRLKASEFIAGKIEHIDILKAMGIKIQIMTDGRLQLVHQANEAHTTRDAQNGLIFMNEMLDLSKENNFYIKNEDYKPVSLAVFKQKYVKKNLSYLGGPAQFGLDLKQSVGLFGLMEISNPIEACTSNLGFFKNKDNIQKKIVLARRGSCLFIDKVRNLESLSVKAVIIYDNIANTSFLNSPLFAMSGDGQSDLKIPSMFLFANEAKDLLTLLERTKKRLIIYIGSKDSNLMRESFYLQLNELRNYAEYDLELKCKKESFFSNFIYSENVCLKGDYMLLKGFFDYFNAIEKEEITRFDKAGVIKLLFNKHTGNRELKFDVEDILVESGIDLTNNEDLIEFAFNEIRKKLEANTNILEMENSKNYFEMLFNVVNKLVRTFTTRNLNLKLTNENILLLNNLSNNIEPKKRLIL